MVQNYYFVLAGFVLDFYILALILAIGSRFLYEAKHKENQTSQEFTKGLGLFFIAIASSALIYGMDLASRTFFNHRIFPAENEYKEMGLIFSSFHIESYFIAILIFILLALGWLMKPIELNIMNRKSPIFSKLCLGLSPVPLIIRILEVLTLPQEGSVLYWIFSGSFIVVWLIIIFSIFQVLGLYIKTAIKGAGEMKARGSAIFVSLIIWLATIFSRPTFLKEMESNPYIFWLLPLIEFGMIFGLVYGFTPNLDLQKSDTTYLYQNWFFRVFLAITIAAVSIYFSILFWDWDWMITDSWHSRAIDGTTLKAFGDFMDQSIFSGEPFGGQDISYILLIPFVLIYLAGSLNPKLGEKLQQKKLMTYSGYIIAASLALLTMNRAFKAFFGRTRPGDLFTIEDGVFQAYSPMWTWGSQELSEAFSHGSFTSGHTTTASMVIIFAFLLIKTRKSWLISLGFLLTIGYTAIMGFGRVVHGAHYPSDTLWALVTGLLMIMWVYFGAMKVPEQERGEFKVHAKFGELRWGINFLLFGLGLLAMGLGIKYTILDFEFYWPIAIVVGPLISWIFYKRMNYVIYGKTAKSKNE